MKKELATHQDFKDEKNRLEYFLHARGQGRVWLARLDSILIPSTSYSH